MPRATLYVGIHANRSKVPTILGKGAGVPKIRSWSNEPHINNLSSLMESEINMEPGGQFHYIMKLIKTKLINETW